MDQSTNDPTLTLQDIAELAKVRRAVVSMWRRRPQVRGERIPFPESVDRIDGLERFRRSEIVDWLERTGRGNNPEFRLDASGVTVPEAIDLETLVTLLCLQVLTGAELGELTPGECVELAHEFDPGDELMAAELGALLYRVDACRFIDELMECAYGPADALDRIEASRAGRALAERDLTPGAFAVLRTITESCRRELEPDGVPLLTAGESPALVLALADEITGVQVSGTGAAARALRRRATIRDIDLRPAEPGPRVLVVSVVGREVGDALEVVDEALLELGPGEIAVVVGPAAALCDDLRGEAENIRSKTLRYCGLVMALRLPRGMWREAHRQALGVWICAGGADPLAAMIADLGLVESAELDHDELATDISAALGDASARVARTFRYARPARLSDIRAGHSVVPHGAGAARLRVSTPTDDVARVHAATLITAEPIEPFDVLVTPRPGNERVARRSLAELAGDGRVRMHRGRRVDTTFADAAGTVAVLSADGSTDGVFLDPFDAQHHYGRGMRTEPGDVIFLERPRPLARVDPTGGALVAAPSRILRLHTGAGLGPYALAAVINQLPAHLCEWKSWNVPRLSNDESMRLESVLAEATGYEQRLRGCLRAVDEVRSALIEGIGAGTVSLDTAAELVL